MTGKPFKVTRVVLSDAVKKQSEEGLYSDGLDPDNLSIKAANASPDKKPTYENTDNRTRTVGAAKKGMAEEPGGFRYEAKSKWAPGKTLKLHASRKSRFSLSNEANIGWVEDSAEVTPAQYINYLRTKPSIRLRKYKVNKATNEIIENSEQTLDPFSLNGDKTVSESSLNEKRLPGMTLGGRVRSLVARAAGKFGVLVDENGKFRCPPGTPAANQFTDMTGKNCFVFVADQIVAHAKNIADGLSSGEGIKNTAKNLYGFLSWLDNGAIPGIGRTVWRDENGKRIRNIKKWREARATQFGRTFVNGMVRAQDRLEQQDRTISELLSGLGIDAPDDKKRTNADLIEAFDKLAEMGLWDITVDGRMDETTVRTLVGQRLAAIPGFSKLSPERKRALIEADTERWYTNERAMLEAALDHFVLDPEMAKKIGNIKFETKIPGRDVMDEASTHFYFGSESGELRSQIRIDLPELMKNQEAELPQLADDERLRIDVVGAKNDAEAASTLSDFLVTVDGHSKTLAGMVEERAFARHVMKHEISHTIQGEAVAQMIKKQIEEKGSVSVRFSDGKVGEYSDIKDMPADAIIALMKRPSSDINLEALAKVVSRTDVVGFLAGDYPKMYFNDKDGLQLWAVEALAELWALRDLGIVYGDDIDAALEWMDSVSDGKYAPERIKRTNAAAALKADPPEAGSRPFRDTLVKSMSEANKFRKQARKRELDSLKNWASNRETDESEVFERAAHLAKMREDLVNEFVEAEKAGVPTDSPEMRRKAEKVFELDQESKALESAWLSRFALSDSKNKSAYLRRFRSSVEEKRYAEGTLSGQRMDEIRKERLVAATKEAAQEMSVEELSDLIVSQNISSMESGLTEEAKSEILEAKKAAMAVLREKVIREGDSRSWGKARRDIQKRVDEIITPPDTLPIKRPKKFRGDRAAETYASEHFREQMKGMTISEVNALAELSDSSKTEIAQSLWGYQRDRALESINRRHRNLQSEAAQIDPTSREQGSVDDQVKNILVPALTAIDKSIINDDIEMEAIIPMPSAEEVGDIDSAGRIELEGLVTGDVLTAQRPALGSAIKNSDGSDVMVGDKKMQRVVIQVPKGSKGTFPSWSFDRDERGTNSPQKLTIPPGALRVVGVRDDGTVIARVVEQKSAIETIEKFALSRPRQASPGSSNVDIEGINRRAGKSAKKAIASKSTKDSIAPKKEESSRAKKINKTESKRTTIASRGVGSGKAEEKKPLIQPAESDIKPDEVDPRTGRPVMKTIKNMSVDELLNRRAAAYSRLLDPDFANDRNGFQGTERATLSSLDNELANRGEIVSNLPQPPEFDPNHVPGSKSRAPYKRTAGNSKSSNSAPTSGRSRAGNAGRRGTRTRTSTGTGPEGSGLSSGRGTGTERAESIRRKKSEISEKVAKRAEDSKQDIEKLEKAIKELEENGRWIGGDLGIVLGMSRDTQTETVHVTGTAPNNRTKEQLADSLPQVIEAAKIKLDRLKKEAELREFELKTKQIREEQGILDLEDIPDEIRLELEEETERLMAMSPEERQKYLQPEGWPDDVAVIHVGASELEDGVLNPAKTVGQRGAGGLESGAGNTGALNETAIDTQRAKIDGKRRRMSILSNIKDSDAENFTISNTDEKNALSEIGVIARVGDTVSISDFRDRIDATNELIEKEIERLEKPMKRLAEANMGFLSSYEFRGDIVSAGYFGRNSEKQIPHDVAEKYSEYEVAILKKKEKITDSFMYDRWRRTLRGGAHLVIGKREEDISQQFGPSTEMQILGVNKPNFSYSARTFDRDEIDKVSTAIMARAMKLHREGREITPEAVLAERLSSGREIGSERLSSGAKQRTDEILGKARDRGADIDRQEREIVPLLREAARERRLDPNTIGRIKKNLSQDNISSDDKQVIKNLVDSGKTQLEILREVSGDDSFGQRLDVLEEIATSRGDNELKQQIVDFRKYVSSMTPEQFNSEVEEAIKVFESPFDERPTVLVQDPMGVIAQGRYETVHQGRATQGGRVSGMDVAGIRVVAENQLLGMPGDTDTEISALRPASSMTLQRRHSEMREKRLKEIYGDDVEIQHNGPTIGSSGKTEALTGSRKRSSKSGDQYGRSSIILRPEVSERTLSVNGDSISDVSSSGNDIMTPGARLSNLSKDGETAAMFFDPLAVLFEARTGRKDTIASAGNNPTQRYVEGLVVGSFDLSDVESIVAEPFELRGEGIWGWGDTAMSFPGVRPEASFTNLIGAARERDRLAEKHGVDLVMDSRDMPLDEVEPFNASMTRAWVQQKIDSGQWKGVSIDQIVTGSGTTPYEALLRYNKINVENGGQEPFFDHPSNRNADERRIRENFLSMVDEELTRITGKKEEKKSGVPAGIANKTSTAFIKKTRFKIKIA